MSYKTDQSAIDQNEYWYDERAAEGAVRYIEANIRHVKGRLAGELIKLEDWQKDEIIKPIFGWKHRDTNLRKFTSAYIEIPKKSGKSFLAACFAAIFLDIEREGGSEIVGVAWGRKQASLVFDVTKGVIQKSQRLKDKCSIYAHSITAPDGVGGIKSYKVLSKEAGAEDGINPQLAIIDELHVHKTDEVVEMVEKSMGARDQPLSFTITTAGDNVDGIGYKKREYSINVVEGKINDPNHLVCIYGADKEDDPFSEETWRKANPNYGISIGRRAYEKEANKARASAASLNSFKRYYLNIWTKSRDGWVMDHDYLASSKYKEYHDAREELKGQVCFAGLDLSSVSDLTAFTLLFPRENGTFASLNWFWLPEHKGTGAIQENKNLNYLDWVKNGHIVETEGNVVDYEHVKAEILRLAQDYDIRELAYDPYNAPHIVPALADEGITVSKFRQGLLSMSAPTKNMEKLILGGQFEHYQDPVLRWMFGNATIKQDEHDNKKVIKDKNKPDLKVDGVISNIMALGLAMDWNDKNGSYIEDAGGIWFI